MEYRKPEYTKDGSIKCEINHPKLGWIPFTASKDDPEQYGRDLFYYIGSSKKKIKKYVEPKAAPVAGWQVNRERNRRLELGTTFDISKYGKISIQGRPEDQITFLSLESTAKAMKENGVTSAKIPFRDRNNKNHILTPDQVLELVQKGKAYAQAIYQASWDIKDRYPIPKDYADDQHWPGSL